MSISGEEEETEDLFSVIVSIFEGLRLVLRLQYTAHQLVHTSVLSKIQF